MNKNSPEFIQGQKDGIVGTTIAMIKIIDGTDTGALNTKLAQPELEKTRRAFLSWREFLIKNQNRTAIPGSELTQVLVSARKLLE